MLTCSHSRLYGVSLSVAMLVSLFYLSSSFSDETDTKRADAIRNKQRPKEYDRKKVYLIVVNQSERKAVEGVDGKLLPNRVYMRWEERLPEVIDGKLKVVTGGWGLDITNEEGLFRDEPRQLLNRDSVLVGRYLGDNSNGGMRKYLYLRGAADFYDLWKEADPDKPFGYTTMLFLENGKIQIGKPIFKGTPVDP